MEISVPISVSDFGSSISIDESVENWKLVWSKQNDVVAGHCVNFGELEGTGSVQKRSGGCSVRDQQASQEASNQLVTPP